jgi:dTDP-4-amino-4,6-dideoxygalactose transaminase
MEADGRGVVGPGPSAALERARHAPGRTPERWSPGITPHRRARRAVAPHGTRSDAVGGGRCSRPCPGALVAWSVPTATDANVPLLDLRAEIRALRPALDDAWSRVVGSGQFVLGPEVDAFEAEAAAYLGVRHAVGLNSGTDALTIALRALGVGAGDEVITSPFSFFATSETLLLLGAVPVFVDLVSDGFVLDPVAVAAAVGPRTRAILPVHLFGELAPMAELSRIARSGGLALIEDAAQAFGARYHARCRACPTPGACSDALHGRAAGALGDAAAFSFYPTKNLGAMGDGGLLTTDDDAVAASARRLRNHGSERRYHHLEAGYNSRLDALQAAVLRVKLPWLDGWTDARRRVAARYDTLLAGLDGVVTPAATPGHVYHQYTVRLPADRRDTVAERLREAGVATMVYYPHTLERYGGRVVGDLPLARRVATEVLSLPIYPSLTEEAQDRVVRSLRAAL